MVVYTVMTLCCNNYLKQIKENIKNWLKKPWTRWNFLLKLLVIGIIFILVFSVFAFIIVTGYTLLFFENFMMKLFTLGMLAVDLLIFFICLCKYRKLR